MQPEESSYLLVETEMSAGMGGPHLFEITVQSDSPAKPVQKLYFRALFQ